MKMDKVKKFALKEMKMISISKTETCSLETGELHCKNEVNHLG